MRQYVRRILVAASLIALGGSAGADTLAVWSFNSGSTQAERLAASNAVSGAVASGLAMNTDAGGYGFRYAGITVPNNDHDGYGFGGVTGDAQVMFTHRANYFDASPVPVPRPTTSDYTSFGSAATQGTGAGLGNGNAPISFTVSAFLGQTVTISNLTVACAPLNPGSNLIVEFQEAGESAGPAVTLNAAGGWMGAALLNAPVVIESGMTKTFTINLNSGQANSKHNIDSMELNGSVVTTGAGAVPIAEWNFNDRSSLLNALAASAVTSGATVSGLTMNTDVGGFGFDYAGLNNVPSSVHDGYGFGGNSGESVMFLHRAEYFDASPVPSPRPTVNDYTSFGPASGSGAQGTAAGLGDGNAPVFFTVTAETGKVVIVESVTCYMWSGASFILNFQEAGAADGTTVTLPAGNNTGTAVLNAPLVIENGETKTFTMNFNSGNTNQSHLLNGFVLNGAVENYATATVYELWLDSFGLSGGDAELEADIENGGLGDGLNNLMEYALGGDPTVDDAAGVLPTGDVSADGSWFYYVHSEREDDETLTYTVLLDDDLVDAPGWSTNGISFVGESAANANGYKSVTNRTDTGSREFVTLQVEKD